MQKILILLYHFNIGLNVVTIILSQQEVCGIIIEMKSMMIRMKIILLVIIE